jgi:hypothetical protein
MPSVLIQDPHHPYAEHLIKLCHERYGLSAVCFFTDPKARALYAHAYPTLRSPLVEAVYDIRLQELEGFAERLRNRHEIVGVVPFLEPTVLPAALLAERLKLGWNRLETMRRFRDKHALKEHLRVQHPNVRVNASRLVKSLEDVLPGGVPPFARYVIKPNDGWGNDDVEMFDDTTPCEVVAAFVRAARRPLVIEEYIEGVEYFVNGQVDAHGEAAIVAAFRYTRVAANGRANIDYETRRVRHAAPTFGVLEEYTRQVVRASGLVRCPFHVEMKIDGRGPCLIEFGARLAGNGNAWVCNDLHGGQLDVFAAAAHSYVSDADYGPLGFDWEHYDATDVVYVHGVATRRERIHTVEGVAEVERLASFDRWVKKPEVGGNVVPTVSSLTAPWCVLLVSRTRGPADDGDDVEQPDAAAVRALMRINPRPNAIRLARATTRALRARLGYELRWRVARVLRPDDGAKPAMRRRTIDFAAKAANAVVRRLQLKGLMPGHRASQPGYLLAPSRVDQANEVLRWVKEYIAAPHPQLGRKGAICPYVYKATEIDRLVLAFHDEVERLKTRFPITEPDKSFASVVLVFPNIPDERLDALDRMHGEMKSHLMQSDVMVACFHKRNNKPALYNPDFPLYRAPLPCLVVRHMDVRDIAFLGHNRVAFDRYRQRFEGRFSDGLVSNEFGHVDMFTQAVERFPKK